MEVSGCDAIVAAEALEQFSEFTNTCGKNANTKLRRFSKPWGWPGAAAGNN
jgi:hypothetical protein